MKKIVEIIVHYWFTKTHDHLIETDHFNYYVRKQTNDIVRIYKAKHIKETTP